MTADPLVDQIVRDVLERIASEVKAARTPARGLLNLQVGVVTAEVLEAEIGAGKPSHVLIEKRTVLTPSARDWLHERKIGWSRADAAATDAGPARAKVAIVLNETPALARLLGDLAAGSPWRRESASAPETAVSRAIEILNANKTAPLVVFSDQPHALACAMNRNSAVRAAVACRVDEVKQARTEMSANVLCIDSRERSYFELRGMLRAMDSPAGSVPQWLP